MKTEPKAQPAITSGSGVRGPGDTLPVALLQTGHGGSHGHFGEILQGVGFDAHDKIHRCLVTMPCQLFGANATFAPDDSGCLRVEPTEYWKAWKAAKITLAALGLQNAHIGGVLTVECNIPSRLGCGASTASVIATVRSVANALTLTIHPEMVARIAVQAERASDSLMFDDVRLFAHREGHTLEKLGEKLPPVAILAVNTESPETNGGIDTLGFSAARYNGHEMQCFRALRGALRRAIRQGDAELLGRVATESARINERFLPKPHFARLNSLIYEVKALGLVVAHSGTVAGLMFAPGPQSDEGMEHARAVLSKLGLTQFGRFQTP